MKKKTALLALIACAVLLAACGNKGSLVRPAQALATTAAG